MWLVSELFEPAGELLSSHPLGSLSVRHERSQSPRDFLAAAVDIRKSPSRLAPPAGPRFRFGLDSLHYARQTGASPIVLARMLANIGVDFLLGGIPLVGDAFDLAWKANRKNARLLEQHLRASAWLRDLRLD